MGMFKKDVENYFIPNKENNFAPHGLQKAAMIGMLCLVLLSFAATNILSVVWMGSYKMVGSVLPAVIVDLTNKERKTESLGVLTRNSTLDAAAQLKANDMAKNEYFAHYSPDGISPWYWFGQVKYNFVHAGENLAIHFTDSSDIVDAWMASPSHRENIMNGNYTEIGIGTAAGTYEGFKTIYVVQLFGTPAAPAPVATLATPVVAGASTDEVKDATTSDTEVLSESVSVSENIAVVEAEPVKTVVAEPAYTEPPVLDVGQVVATSGEAITPSEATTSNIEVTDTGVALFSDFISTSTGGIPASIVPTQTDTVTTAPFFLSLMTQPHTVLQILYVVIGLFVLCSLLISIFIEIRHQQPMQIAYSVGLLAAMFVLFYVHTILSAGALIL